MLQQVQLGRAYVCLCVHLMQGYPGPSPHGSGGACGWVHPFPQHQLPPGDYSNSARHALADHFIAYYPECCLVRRSETRNALP